MIDPTAAAAFESLLSRRGGDLLILVDDQLRIVRAGHEAAQLAERSLETLAGMSLIAAFGSAPLDLVARQAIASGEAVSGEADLGHLGTRHFAVDAVPLRSAEGLVLFLHDITALRRMERVRRDFVANIGHELRTPLTSIKLLAETLTSGAVDDPATTADFATQIEREVDHLAQLVDELLDLSMIESGATTLSIEALDPETVVAASAERITPVAERREVTIRRFSQRATDDVRALGDAGRLSQALLNLAHNAVKYSQHGGEVRIGWEASGDRVRFIVADDGIGIPEAHQARIFERFYKVDRSRARDADSEQLGGSAGLGLAIVRHIAEAHRGSVGLSSEEGVGSTFWIEVPRAGD
jgi:two-component system, OmpR family, phosphate regulon sensor histidine kinase PhoR